MLLLLIQQQPRFFPPLDLGLRLAGMLDASRDKQRKNPCFSLGEKLHNTSVHLVHIFRRWDQVARQKNNITYQCFVFSFYCTCVAFPQYINGLNANFIIPGLQVPQDGLLCGLLCGLFRDYRPEELLLAGARSGPAGAGHEQGVPNQGDERRRRPGEKEIRI